MTATATHNGNGNGQLPLLSTIVRENPHKTKPCAYCAGLGTIEATDMFCGAGGSSLGLEFVCCPRCGRQLVQVTQAINHWDLAVQAHNANFPNADHDVHDVHEIPARRFRRTPLFWASPECVNHTACKGKRDDSPEAQRSRATFRDIIRFTAYHRYDAIIVENVIEARLWCEHEDCACGHEFNKWYQEMLDLGYEAKIVYFNSQFALPTPQSRDRMYVVFWREGMRAPFLDYRPASWCPKCEEVVNGKQAWKKASKGSARDKHVFEWGRYGPQYLYRCPNEGCGQPVAPAVIGARSIIDFGLPIERIGDRKYKDGSPNPLAPNTRKRIRVGWENLGKRQPAVVQVGGHLYERSGYARVWSLDDPLRTVITANVHALVTPERSGNVPVSVDQPVPTVAGHAQLAMVVRAGGQSPTPRGIGEPMNTITAHDRQIGLVVQAGGPTGSGRNPRDTREPLGTAMPENHAALVMQNMSNNVPRSDSEPAPPVTTGANHMLVQVCRGSTGDDLHRTQDIDQPTRTIAGHGEFALVELRQHGGLRHIDEPTPTTIGNHQGMLVYNGVPGFVRDIGDAIGTITARDKQSLLVPYYRTGVARPVGEPMGTVTGKDRDALVITEADIDDCYFRMLKWPELLKAQVMHQHRDGAPYMLDARVRNRRGQVVGLSSELRTKMIGNAVSAPVATMLGQSIVNALFWPDDVAAWDEDLPIAA